jgi:plasmid stabilization system protein ParE
MSIDIQPRAAVDIEIAADELERWRAGAEVRFVARLNDALARLERLPYLAPRHEPESALFPGLREYLIPRDYGYLIFYVPADDGISVARVLHHSRNITAIFNPRPDPDPPTTPGS